MKTVHRLLRTLGAMAISAACWNPAGASIVHVDFNYAGSGISATGYADFEASQLTNPEPHLVLAQASRVLLVISGDVDRPAVNGWPASLNVNGTYTEADFPFFKWYTMGAPLDFSSELVGQPIDLTGLPCTWGPDGATPQGCSGGDFAPVGAPNTRFASIGHFAFQVTDRGNPQLDEWIVLTSAVPHVIPEPPTRALLAFAGLALVSVRSFRRSSIGASQRI